VNHRRRKHDGHIIEYAQDGCDCPAEAFPGSFSFSFFVGDGKVNLLSCDMFVMLQQSLLCILLVEITYGSYDVQGVLGIAEIRG
jgi:hypothetical protein